jgi:hypothetical protein
MPQSRCVHHIIGGRAGLAELAAAIAAVTAVLEAAEADLKRRQEEARRLREEQLAADRETRLEQAERRRRLAAATPATLPAEGAETDSWQRIEPQRAREYAGYAPMPAPASPTPSPQPMSTPQPVPVPSPKSSPTPGAGNASRDFRYDEVVRLFQALPSLSGPSAEYREPGIVTILPNGILEVGRVRSLRLMTSQNPDMWIGTDGSLGARSGEPPTSTSTSPSGWRVTFTVPGETIIIPTNASAVSPHLQVSTGSSVSLAFEPNGFWNSVITVDVNPVHASANVGGGKVVRQSGAYVKFKPSPFVVVGVVATVIALTPVPDEFSFPVLARGLLEFVRP